MTDSLSSIDAMHDDTEPELAGLARIVNDGSLPDAHRRAAKLAYDRLLDDLDRPVGEVVAHVFVDEEGNTLVPDDQAAAIKQAFENAPVSAPFGKPLRKALRFYLAPSPAIGRETDLLSEISKEGMEELAKRLTRSDSGESYGMEPLTIAYTNWRGEHSIRTIRPREIWYGSTEWHPEPQWLLRAWDVEKNALRDFALSALGAQP